MALTTNAQLDDLVLPALHELQALRRCLVGDGTLQVAGDGLGDHDAGEQVPNDGVEELQQASTDRLLVSRVPVNPSAPPHGARAAAHARRGEARPDLAHDESRYTRKPATLHTATHIAHARDRRPRCTPQR